MAIIGITAPGGFYSSFADKYFNIIDWLRQSLLWGTKLLLSAFAIQTYYYSEWILVKIHGNGIRMVYSCVGFGVMSFWVAFVFANEVAIKKKLTWMFGGLLLIWIINVCRLALVLLSTNNYFHFPLMDHHTWFTIFSYLLVFILIFYFNKSSAAPR